MSKTFSQLQRIDSDRKITKDTAPAFLHHLQHCLLLALRERELLTITQYRHAEEALSRQHPAREAP